MEGEADVTIRVLAAGGGLERLIEVTARPVTHGTDTSLCGEAGTCDVSTTSLPHPQHLLPPPSTTTSLPIPPPSPSTTSSFHCNIYSTCLRTNNPGYTWILKSCKEPHTSGL